jgi:hypothetical protein
MATTLQIGATAQISKVKFASLTVKLNTMDCVLEDPTTVPALGDAVTMTNPTWTGTVTQVEQADIVDRATGHRDVKITATNTVAATASAAPFNLSDVPNNSTTYGYRSLRVGTTQNTDGTTTAKGSCIINQQGLWPAMTFLLTSANLGQSAVNYSVQNVTVTWPGNQNTPEYAIEFGDPIVTMSVWVNSSAAGVLPITTTKITDGAVTTPKVAAGAITADKLTATLILATLIETAAAGARVEFDSNGIRLYDTSDAILLNAPTDGSPVSVSGELTASTLVATGASEFDGANLFAKNSVTTLGAGVLPPTIAPTLAKGWQGHSPAVVSAPSSGYGINGISHLKYDANGGASGTTAVIFAVVAWAKASNPNIFEVIEWKISDWSVDRRTTLTGLTMGTDWYPSDSMGICRLGTSWYIGAFDNATTSTWRVNKVTRSTGAQSATATRTVAGSQIWDITTDGTNLLLLRYDFSPFMAVETWTTAPAFSSSKTITGYPTGSSVNSMVGLDYDGTNWYIDVEFVQGTFPNLSWYTRTYRATPSTGAVVANTDFLGQSDGDYSSIYWDGTVFHHASGSSVNGGWGIYDHTTWDWTTASSKYWVGYSWYDSAGTTHETALGPRSNITMDRRMRLNVTNPTIPVGGADDPDSVRVYMLPSATAPALGTFKQQSSDSLTSRYLTTYNAAGAADGGGTAFPGGAGALLQGAAQPGTLLQGDGFATFGKTWGFQRTGASTTQASGNLPFATVVKDSHSGQYASSTWTVPTNGAGIWLLTCTVTGTVTGAVSVSRGGINVNGASVADFVVWPLAGTNVSGGAAWVGALADGDALTVSLAVVNGTSYTMRLSSFSAVRIFALDIAA